MVDRGQQHSDERFAMGQRRSRDLCQFQYAVRFTGFGKDQCSHRYSLGLRRRPDVLRLREQEAELVMEKNISVEPANAASIRTASVHSSRLGEAVCSQPLEAKVQ